MKTFVPPLLSLLVTVSNVCGEDSVRPGRFVVEPPTLICLGFEWDIAGDDNRNARVDVSYRESGKGEWKAALPLLRMGGERVTRIGHSTPTEYVDYTVPHKFAGSILDLKPDTAYEVRLTMKDPDGVQGEAVQSQKVRTRAVPKAAEGGRVLHVYPPDWKGKKQEPAFTGLYQAYYGAGGGDWSAVWGRKVRPGDTILVHAGLYKADRLKYDNALSLPFDGTYLLTVKATADKPIVIKGAGDGEVVFDGDNCAQLFNVMGAAYHIFDGLTVRNAEIAFLAGLKDVVGATGLTVRNCRIEDVGEAVVSQYAGSKDFYIADNVMLGRLERDRIGTRWPQLKSYNAVKVYGTGHVVCHNAIAFFFDGVTVCTHGMPTPGQEAVSIDFYNNDIHVVGDNCIEADGGVHNIRVMRNRVANSVGGALSAQPIFGGPAYFIRNVVYHANHSGFKFHSEPAGVLVYHNTVVVENNLRHSYSNAHFRNNLFLGTDAPDMGILVVANKTPYSTYDYNGYRPNQNAANQYLWDGKSYASLAELKKATGQESHGVEVDFNVFENLRSYDPAKPHVVYHSRDLDFGLRRGSKAVDAGVRLPNVNDNFNDRAPDLGACEIGKEIHVYGPRWLSGKPFYK